MVVPAEHDAVVGVRGPATGVLIDVMDLAPTGLDVATGDDASAVAQPDRAPLVMGEHPIGRT